MKLENHLRAQVLFAAVSLVGMTTAMGQTTSVSLQMRSLAASCAACHGTDGVAVPGSSMVALAGYPKESLVTQMRAFRDGSRGATVMHQIARGYTDQQIEGLASYFANRSAGRP